MNILILVGAAFFHVVGLKDSQKNAALSERFLSNTTNKMLTNTILEIFAAYNIFSFQIPPLIIPNVS